MSDLTQESLDQTAFSESAPMMDQNGESKPPVAKKTDSEDKPEEKRPIKKPIPLPLMAGGVLLVVILISFLAITFMPKEQAGPNDGGPEATATPGVVSNLPPELQKAITSLGEDVKEADPQANDLPFPPVSFQLHLRVPGSQE